MVQFPAPQLHIHVSWCKTLKLKLFQCLKVQLHHHQLVGQSSKNPRVGGSQMTPSSPDSWTRH